MKLMQEYRERVKTERPWYPIMLEAAADPALDTEYLFRDAMLAFEVCWAGDCADDHSCFCPFSLLVLQQRVTPEVKQRAFDLLKAYDPLDRYLGTCILREFPGLHGAPHAHAEEVVQRLEALLAKEDDEDVFHRGITAISWQRHPSGIDILLGYRRHEDEDVRRAIADGLPRLHPETEAMPASVANALLEFTTDSYLEVRWSVFYDIAQYPFLFRENKSEFLAAAIQATKDPVADVAREAERAVNALLTMKA